MLHTLLCGQKQQNMDGLSTTFKIHVVKHPQNCTTCQMINIKNTTKFNCSDLPTLYVNICIHQNNIYM